MSDDLKVIRAFCPACRQKTDDLMAHLLDCSEARAGPEEADQGLADDVEALDRMTYLLDRQGDSLHPMVAAEAREAAAEARYLLAKLQDPAARHRYLVRVLRRKGLLLE